AFLKPHIGQTISEAIRRHPSAFEARAILPRRGRENQTFSTRPPVSAHGTILTAAMTRRGWFEISHAGWRRLSSSRPLGRLLLEAVQNAFDAQASVIVVDLAPDAIVVEDDARAGFLDERFIFTVFLSDKPEDPTRRGRMGRGLKELIAA